MPARLDLGALSERRAAQLEAMDNDRPGTIEQLDYLLGLLDRIRTCMKSSGSEHGEVTVILHFDVDSEEHVGHGTQFELVDSSLSDEGDRALTACADEVHRDQLIKLPQAAAGQEKYYWGTSIVFPTSDDPIYRWFH